MTDHQLPSHDAGEDSLLSGHPPPRYAGEDTRPTSKKELAGWYMYAFAAETYVICGKLVRVSTFACPNELSIPKFWGFNNLEYLLISI